MNNSHKQTTALYNHIYKNAQMGMGTTAHLLKGTRGPQMEQELKLQNEEYAYFCKNSKKRIHALQGKVKGLSKLEEWRTDSMVSLNLLYDSSDSHVAEMMMTGSSMGVIGATKMLKEYPQASEDSKKMLKNLSEYEASRFEKFKRFL